MWDLVSIFDEDGAGNGNGNAEGASKATKKITLDPYRALGIGSDGSKRSAHQPFRE